MKVILLQNIKNFGRMGDVKNVSDGYARNFLLPKNLAKAATETNLKEAELLKKKEEAVSAAQKEKALKAAEALKDSSLEFARKATKTGKLFSSVSADDIAEELTKTTGLKVDADAVNLKDHEGHIKNIGEHVIKIELAPEVIAEVKVVVVEEK